jgi:cyclic pyranopterin phosphate synthase
MPAEIFGEGYQFLRKAEILTFEEITRLAELFVRLGVEKIRITGGEPLLRQELEKLVEQLSRIEGVTDLTLTTNGYLLPNVARSLKEAGLERITVSLDSLDEDVFKALNGRRFGVEKVLEGIRAAEAAGFSRLKINTVVQKGVNDHTLVDLARYFRGSGHIVRFIEFMDVGTINGWKMDQVVSAEEVLKRIGDVYPLEPVAPNYRGEVANRFRYLDGHGEIGVIASVTRPFCGDCTRARLTTDGKLYTCLFAGQGTGLREPVRAGASDADLLGAIEAVWQSRDDRYSELRTIETPEAGQAPKIEMYQIGG